MQMKENINLEILFILIFIVIASGIYGCSKNEKIAEGRYTVYYFHPTARCEGCINMESYMKELIEKKYKDIIIFKAINNADEQDLFYLFITYIVTSNPKRISVAAGFVHMVKILKKVL